MKNITRTATLLVATCEAWNFLPLKRFSQLYLFPESFPIFVPEDAILNAFWFNPRTAGGCLSAPPSGFSQIAKKRRRVAPPNLP